MVRFAAVAALVTLAIGPGSLQAQDPVLSAPDTRLAGVWQLDPARSDSLPMAARMAAAAGPRGADAAAGAGGGAQTRTGGRGGGGMSARGGGGGARGGGGGGVLSGAEGVPGLIADIAPAQMTIEVSQTKTGIALDTATVAFEWQTDKKKRPVSLPRGGLIEVEASWWTKTLQTIRKVDGNTELKKEFKVTQDGDGLEVKVNAKVMGQKSDLKLYYRRVP